MADMRVPGNLKGLDTWARGALKDYPKPNRINGSLYNDPTRSTDSPNLHEDPSRAKLNIK